jgi:hypothetical protein
METIRVRYLAESGVKRKSKNILSRMACCQRGSIAAVAHKTRCNMRC